MTVLTTIGLQQSIRQGWPVVRMLYLDHPDGEINVWSGVGDLAYGGETYGGIGGFGRISGIGGAKRLALRQVVLELAGVPEEAVKHLNKDVRGRTARAWIAGLDSDGRKVNGAPWQVVDGRADYQELPLGDDGNVMIRIHVIDPVYSLERAQNLVWSPEWIRATHGPEISGLDLLSSLADASENWTRT